MSDAERLSARRDALAAALTGLSAAELADDALVAAVATAPGFRRTGLEELSADAGHDPANVLAMSRARRRTDLARILAVAPGQARGEASLLADWLTGIREELVHPMTGESMTLLDWVNRGGPLDLALEGVGGE